MHDNPGCGGGGGCDRNRAFSTRTAAHLYIVMSLYYPGLLYVTPMFEQ